MVTDAFQLFLVTFEMPCKSATWTVRNRLLQCYDSSFFNLDLNRSSEIEREISDTRVFLAPINLEQSELLKKLEQLLEFTQDLLTFTLKWEQAAKELTDLFKLPTQSLNVERVRQISKIADICLSADKLERQWFNPTALKQTQELVQKAKKDYTEINTLKTQIEKLYSS